MNVSRFTWLAAALVAATAAPAAWAAGSADVNYVKPEQFSDAGRGAVDRERTMAGLTQYLQQLARRLPDGQTLKLEFTDIDLAGELRPGRTLHDLRVLRGGADWPQLQLRYTLVEGNRTLKSGETRLSDPAYMFGRAGYPVSQTELGYEKRMLKQWFDATIVAQR